MQDKKGGKKFRKPDWASIENRQPPPKKYYDNFDMMALFNVGERTLQRWRDDGELPFVKIRGRIYYIAKEIDRLMEERSRFS